MPQYHWTYEQIHALIEVRRTTNQVNTFYYLKIQILLIYIIIFLGVLRYVQNVKGPILEPYSIYG
jgi:hypothetical protein